MSRYRPLILILALLLLLSACGDGDDNGDTGDTGDEDEQSAPLTVDDDPPLRESLLGERAAISPETLPMLQVFLTLPSNQQLNATENAAILSILRDRPQVSSVEGRAINPVSWRPATNETAFQPTILTAFSEPLFATRLHPLSLVEGNFPGPSSVTEILVEEDFANRHVVGIGDSLSLEGIGGRAEVEVVGLVSDPYVDFTPNLPSNLRWQGGLYGSYELARELGTRGLTGILLRFDSMVAAVNEAPNVLVDITDRTPYIIIDTLLENPTESRQLADVTAVVEPENAALAGVDAALAVMPSSPLSPAVVTTVLLSVEEVASVAPGMSLQVDMPEGELEDRLPVVGFDREQTTLHLPIEEGRLWTPDEDSGIVLTSALGVATGQSLGDQVTIGFGSETATLELMGIVVADFPAIYADWELLARTARFVQPALRPGTYETSLAVAGYSDTQGDLLRTIAIDQAIGDFLTLTEGAYSEEGVLISTELAAASGFQVGDLLTFRSGQRELAVPLTGIFEVPAEWREGAAPAEIALLSVEHLAELEQLNPRGTLLPNIYFVQLAEGIAADEARDGISAALLAADIPATITILAE